MKLSRFNLLLCFNVITSFLDRQLVVALLGLIFLTVITRRADLSKLIRFRVVQTIIYTILLSVVVLLLNYDGDTVYWINVVKQGLLKGIGLPLISILSLSALSFNFESHFKLMALTGFILSIISLVFGTEISFSESTPYFVSLMILFYMPYYVVVKFRLGFVMIGILVLYYYVVIAGVYLTSADVALLAGTIITSTLIIVSRKLSQGLIVVIIFYCLTSSDFYSLLKSVGLSPSSAHKISAPFALLSLIFNDFYDSIPWTLHVRVVEFLNSWDRWPLFNITGSGFFATITESSFRYRAALNTYDYTMLEILKGEYFSVHNFSRGFLQFGLSYFVLLVVLYLNSVFVILRKSFSHEYKRIFFLTFYFLVAIWNPYISSFFYVFIFNVMLRKELMTAR